MDLFNIPFFRSYEAQLGWLVRQWKKLEANLDDIHASMDAAAESAEAAHADMLQAGSEKTQAGIFAGRAQESAESIEESARQIDVNSARINNLVANAGDTDNNAELLDIRVGYNGAVYLTAGDAVRAQAGRLYDVFEDLSEGLVTETETLITNLTRHTGYRYDNAGSLSANTPGVGTAEAVEIDVTGGEVIKWVCYYANRNATYNVKYKMSDNSIVPDTNYTTTENEYTFTVPYNCVKLLISCWVVDAVGNNFYLKSVSVESAKHYTDTLVDPITDDLITKVSGEPGKNLFDKTGVYTKIRTGYYRPYNTGGWTVSNEYEVATLDVEGGENYTVNKYNIHVCFFGDNDATQYISGFLANPSNGRTFTVPANAVTLCASLPVAGADSFQIEKGTTESSYTPFVFGVNAARVIGSSVKRVGAGHEYGTIQAAINEAVDGDIILIDPGVYYEAVNAVGKTLHLLGAGEKSTVIQYPGDDYYNPPLEIASGVVENIGFITTATEPAAGAIDTAYCVHIDYDDEIGKYLQFKNCYFESPIRPTVGIGLRENFTLNFTNCNFKSSTFPVYCHEQQANNKTGQKLELVDCSIQSTAATAAIHLQESRAYSGNVVTVLFQRCIAKASGVSGNNIILATTYPNGQTPTGSHYLNLNSFYLDTMSALNNETILDA